MYVHVGEREVFAKPEGGFSPYHFAVVMEVTSKYKFHNIGFSCVFNAIFCNLALYRVNTFV